MIVWGPLVVGVKLTAQLVETAPVVESVLALPSVQLEAEKVPPLFVKLTVPVGAVAEPGVASVTVAVQLVEIGRASCRGGEQMPVVGACVRADRTCVPEPEACFLSQVYEAILVRVLTGFEMWLLAI